MPRGCSVRALENAIAELCLGAGVRDEPAAIRTWLERHAVPEDDIEFLLESGLKRLNVYRELVRNNLYGALEVSMPRTMARLGTRFEDDFSRFLAEQGPRTHYLRDVVDEFLEFVAPDWKAGNAVAPYLWDLARHEALRIQIGAMQSRDPSHVAPELDLDRSVHFIEAARVVRYAHAVHELPGGEADRTVPDQRPVALLVYRSPEHEVRFLELTPMAANLLEALMSRGSTLREAMLQAAAASGCPLDDAALGGAARLLADLAERGALLGAADGHVAGG
jgi:hypothetical protein